MAINGPLDAPTLEAMVATKQFVEVVIAPRVEPGALEVIEGAGSGWKNTRLVEIPEPSPPRFEFRPVEGGLLVQTPDLDAERRSPETSSSPKSWPST